VSPTITADEFARLCQSGRPTPLIDVRTPAEFRALHVTFAQNIPLDRLDADAAAAIAGGDGQPLYVVCQKGGRGQLACDRLRAAGLANVVNIEGGTIACLQAGVPVVRGPAAISLERQVRIAAGSLVLLGVALAWLVHPYWIGLCAFVGAGLVFAGLTDTCGMGLLLARMPWNRTPDATPSCSVPRT
jgi:rhodanese-related sulfurtransferase